MIPLLSIALLPSASAVEPEPAVCPAVPPLVEAANVALIEVEVEEAQKQLKAAEKALLGCREIFDPKMLGTLWLLEGALRTIEGDETAATDAFTASGRVSPDGWSEVYGPAIYGKYELALARDSGASTLELMPPLGANIAWIDGVRVSKSPIETTGGLHALQISDPTGVVLFSQILWLPAGDGMRLETGVPTARKVAVEGPKPADVREAPIRKRVDPLLAGGAGAALVGGALFAWSFERSAAMKAEDDPDALRARFQEHSASRIGGLAVFGLGAAAVGASFAF